MVINRLLKKSFFAGCSKMSICKAPEILRVASRQIKSDCWHADEFVSRPEAYLDVRRNKPAPCLTRRRMRGT